MPTLTFCPMLFVISQKSDYYFCGICVFNLMWILNIFLLNFCLDSFITAFMIIISEKSLHQIKIWCSPNSGDGHPSNTWFFLAAKNRCFNKPDCPGECTPCNTQDTGRHSLKKCLPCVFWDAHQTLEFTVCFL
jgi:hypothetical protein